MAVVGFLFLLSDTNKAFEFVPADYRAHTASFLSLSSSVRLSSGLHVRNLRNLWPCGKRGKSGPHVCIQPHTHTLVLFWEMIRPWKVFLQGVQGRGVTWPRTAKVNRLLCMGDTNLFVWCGFLSDICRCFPFRYSADVLFEDHSRLLFSTLCLLRAPPAGHKNAPFPSFTSLDWLFIKKNLIWGYQDGKSSDKLTI